MKTFIRNIILMGVIVLLLLAAIEISLLYIPNTYSYKRDYVEAHINDIKCLLLGNSHIEEALDPKLMGDGVFNLAISGRPHIYDIELAKMYVPQMKNLKVLIIPFDYSMFYFGREKNNPDEIMKQPQFGNTYKCMYYKYMGIRVDEFWYWPESLNSKLDYLGRFTQSKQESIECDSLGYISLPLSNRTSDWENRFLPKIVDSSVAKNQEKYTLLYEQYKTLAELAKKQGCRLVLLRTPTYKTYISYLNPSVTKEMTDFVSALQKEFPFAEYNDYGQDERFVGDDFHDASHLTDVGAAKFSVIVKEEILEK